MVTLEQIRLLESKIGRAIEFVAKLTEEKARLTRQNEELRETITALRETIEVLKEEKSRVEEEKSRVEEEKNRVEEGIASALGKLDQFEDAIEQTLKAAGSDKNAAGNDNIEEERVMAELMAEEEQRQRRIEQERRMAEIRREEERRIEEERRMAEKERARAEQAAKTAVPPEEDLPASAYTIDEETEDTIEDAIEEDEFEENKSGDSGEAELDIF